MTPRDGLMAMFRGDGTQTHYELISNRGARHAVPAMDAADIILEAVWPQYEAAMAVVDALSGLVHASEDIYPGHGNWGDFETAVIAARVALDGIQAQVTA